MTKPRGYVRRKDYVDSLSRPPFDPNEVEGSPRSKKELKIVATVFMILIVLAIALS